MKTVYNQIEDLLGFIGLDKASAFIVSNKGYQLGLCIGSCNKSSIFYKETLALAYRDVLNIQTYSLQVHNIDFLDPLVLRDLIVTPRCFSLGWIVTRGIPEDELSLDLLCANKKLGIIDLSSGECSIKS